MGSTTNITQDKAADAAKASIDRMADFRDQTTENARRIVTTENARRIVETSLEAASRQAQEVSARLTPTFGIGGEDSQRLAEQSKQNLEAIARCGTVLSQAFQDVSRGWFELSQKQWQRNLGSLQRLTRVRSAHELAYVQNELLLENLQHIVQDGRGIAESSLHAAEEAGKTFANVSSQGWTRLRLLLV